MCGVCGIFAFADGFVCDDATVTRMRDTLLHRGPDDGGSMARPQERVALGHRRLSIVDLSPAGHQPMANEDGSVWIVYNGEVYNHASLRRELEARGHVYRSHTDSETIIHLYEEEGPRCVERLEGMFAFAIWDARRRELFLARDRIGVKPLYYALLPGGLLFGSEVKALLEHPALGRDLDEESFFDYLTFGFVPPPRTMYRGISKLAPAERMTVRSDGSVHRERYWNALSGAAALETAALSDAEAIDRLRELLRTSISKRMMSDVPFGVFLSGGLDSSANVALMAELMDGPVRTFSTAPRGHARYDELSYARLVAQRFGTDHHEVVIDESDMQEFLPRLAHQQDEPVAEWTAVPQHFVTRLARDTGTVVVQCGEGSDEIFHGYDGYVFHRKYAVPFQRLPGPMRRGVGLAASRATRRLGRGIRHGEALYDAGHSALPYWGGALCFRGEVKRKILAGRFERDSYELPERHWQEAERALPHADVFQKMTYLELQQRLPELLLMRLDKICMTSSVEGREPFLDHHLVEFALALPPRLKYRDGVGKWALREAMRRDLPSQVIDRPKQGFGTPMEEWLRGAFGERAQAEVTGSTLREQGLLDYDVVDALFSAHRAGRGDWSKHLWNLYTVSVWHDRWVAGRDDAAPPAA
jgi:asparagine synthase (glutamine-hydrolysing)